VIATHFPGLGKGAKSRVYVGLSSLTLRVLFYILSGSRGKRTPRSWGRVREKTLFDLPLMRSQGRRNDLSLTSDVQPDCTWSAWKGRRTHNVTEPPADPSNNLWRHTITQMAYARAVLRHAHNLKEGYNNDFRC